jgi:hypothetical protein
MNQNLAVPNIGTPESLKGSPFHLSYPWHLRNGGRLFSPFFSIMALKLISVSIFQKTQDPGKFMTLAPAILPSCCPL